MPGSGTWVPPVEVLPPDVLDEVEVDEPPDELELPPDDDPPLDEPPLVDEVVELVVLELELLPPQFFDPAEWPQRQKCLCLDLVASAGVETVAARARMAMRVRFILEPFKDV